MPSSQKTRTDHQNIVVTPSTAAGLAITNGDVRAANMVFTQGPSAHLPRLATWAGLGTISRNSGIACFVYGSVIKTFRFRSEVTVIRESNRSQFSVATLLGAITLAAIVVGSVFRWHRWVLWNSEPYGDPSEQWFIASRQQMYNWTTPCIAAFLLVSAFSIWYAIANRSSPESVIGGLSLAFPALLPLGPLALFSLLIPFVTPLVGCWLLYKHRFFLGTFVMLFSTIWLYFVFHYVDEWFAIYGD